MTRCRNEIGASGGMGVSPMLTVCGGGDRSHGRDARATGQRLLAGGIPLLLSALLTWVSTCHATPASQPSTAPADPALWAKLTDIDQRAGKVKTLRADFRQDKFTALLTKPLVSLGTVRIDGSTMRWDTRQPDRNVMLIDPHEAKIYYPVQKTLEVYPLDKRLGELAASPLPRLDVLRAKFSFEQIPASELAKSAAPGEFIALKLVPIEASLREHVEQVRVLLDVKNAYIVKAEITDSDGDRTVLSFDHVQLNVDVGDLSLKVPAGTTVTHPLEGLDGDPQSSRMRSK